MEFDLCGGSLFSENFGLKSEVGICDAIDVFMLRILGVCDRVNCDAIGNVVLECSKCGAIDFFCTCKLLLFV